MIPRLAYSLEQYTDPNTGRSRWACVHLKTRVWYFPRQYGLKAAARLWRRLNTEANA